MKVRKYLCTYLFPSLFFALLFAGTVYAADVSVQLQIPIFGKTEIKTCTGTTCSGIGDYISLIYNWIVAFAGVAAVLAFTYGGVLWLIAGGESSKTTESKKVMGNALVGLLLALLSYSLLFVISPKLTQFTPLTVVPIAPIALSLGPDLSSFPNLKFIKNIPAPYDANKRSKFVHYSPLCADILSRAKNLALTGIAEGGETETTSEESRTIRSDDDLPGWCHELEHSLNGQLGGALYIGEGTAILLDQSTSLLTKDAVPFIPEVFKSISLAGYALQMFGVTNNAALKVRANQSILTIFDEQISNTVGARVSLDLIKAGIRAKNRWFNMSSSIVLIPYTLAVAATIEKEEIKYLEHSQTKETIRYLIENAITAYKEQEKIAGPPTTGPILDESAQTILQTFKALQTDTDPKTQVLRDLAKRWYNTPATPNWTKEWLGF